MSNVETNLLRLPPKILVGKLSRGKQDGDGTTGSGHANEQDESKRGKEKKSNEESRNTKDNQ